MSSLKEAGFSDFEDSDQSSTEVQQKEIGRVKLSYYTKQKLDHLESELTKKYEKLHDELIQ